MKNQSIKSTKLLLLNNAYPTISEPKKGAYIKSIEDCLIKADIEVDRLVISHQKEAVINKFYVYLKFYIKLLQCNYSVYDYVFIHHFPQLFIPLIFRFKGMKKIVVNFHGGDVIAKNKFERYLNRCSYFFIPRKALFIVPSEYFNKKVIQLIPSLKKRIFYISPSGGVDMNLFKPLKNEKASNNKIDVGYASGIDFNKGIEDLLVLIKSLNPKEFIFHIIIYGKDKEKYLKQLKSINNIVTYKLFKKNDMPLFYSKIDVLFFPSKSESLGLVALESMSCGVPVIGPNDFALSSIIKNGLSGEKFETSINNDFINALNRFLNNRNNYKTRAFIESQYSKELVVDQFKKIFNG